ncbi:unnamed protein product [Rhizophagus irregularis]|uniref:Alpha-1,3-glucosyltransferase n=1 Tax=Rhizophagus irregularis TaxID=588596 RepID=A0A915ZQN2_9GLOM|nr:unnamed protein product [Rhizophagus irregularis]
MRTGHRIFGFVFRDGSSADLAKLLGWTLNESAIGSITRGLVEDVNFVLLPQVKANHTFILTLIFQMISLVKSWEASKLQNFLVSLILNGYSSFLFGWNVHEKQSY